jgi:asparagine synthase (glutamine-hydrolysing)
MSGTVGILNLDGAPVDRRLLGRMTDFMTFRGPDAQKIWIGGNVGFGHTLLKTTFESEHEHQPFTLDGQVWIVADARIDAQDDLIAKLAARTEPRASASGPCRKGITTDVELILRSYHKWGEDCVDHLLGDFAFAIWDAPSQRLFCARDHMGVKPFFYAHLGQTVIFSNTLDCIRQHPAVSDKLNDLAIADFLLFNINQDQNTTSFAEIQRIPPAHRATWSSGRLQVNRYWVLPIDEPIYFNRADDYTDRFRELLDLAVGDRLRTNTVGVMMSDGLDSTTLAAAACKKVNVRAFTQTFEGLVETRRYAGLVAAKLGIPIHYRERKHDLLDPNWHQTSFHTPDPSTNPMNLGADLDWYQHISSHSRVTFCGEGPDNALQYEWQPYLAQLLHQKRLKQLMMDVYTHVVRHRRVPLIPSIPRILRARVRGECSRTSFPEWLNPGFQSSLKLFERWEHWWAPAASLHPFRPAAYNSFCTPYWQGYFHSWDPLHTKAALEVRHPFVDLRVLRYFLAVPVLPWCRAKHLLRSAMAGILPQPILRQPKIVVNVDPTWELLRRSGLPPLEPVHALARYVDTHRLTNEVDDTQTSFWTNFLPRSLNYWLANLQHT